MNTGERIRSLREGLGLTQSELAEKCGYKSKSSINKLELSRKLPADKIEILAKALNTTPSYIMGWDNNPYNDNYIIDISIGNRIKQRRIELGLSQEELAKRMGNGSRASVSTVETGKEDLTTNRIRKFADALETTPGFLMGINNENPSSEALSIAKQYDNLDDREKEFVKHAIKLAAREKI